MPAAAAALGGVPHGSTAVVSLAYRADQLTSRPGHGFLVARDEPLVFGACTWSSAKWAGRAPDGWVLARAFLGERSPALLARPDDEVAAAVHARISRGSRASRAPRRSRVRRWAAGDAALTIGHLGGWPRRWTRRCERSRTWPVVRAPRSGAWGFRTV